MSVVTKAFALLEYFTLQTPELGLSQICRLSGRDKATTYRYLSALETIGFIEQNSVSKQYRIGPAVLHLADIREKTVPRRAGTKEPLKKLADATGETAHASILSGSTLHALNSCESLVHSTRAVIDLQTLPLHATASGICAIAFGPPKLREAAREDRTQFTANTAVKDDALHALIVSAADIGFGVSDRSLENGICSFATPVFDHTGQLCGTVAVACVASRLTGALSHTIREHLTTASQEISHNWGGTVPASVQDLWTHSLNTQTQKELSQ